MQDDFKTPAQQPDMPPESTPQPTPMPWDKPDAEAEAADRSVSSMFGDVVTSTMTPTVPENQTAPATPAQSSWQPTVSGQPSVGGQLPSYQPVDTSGMIVSSPEPTVSMTLPITKPKKSKKKPLMFIGGALAAIILLGGGFVFGFYLPNTPEGVYSASLHNTGLALDHLVDYSKQQQNQNYKSTKYDGSLTVKSASGSYDLSLTGASDKDGNANMAAKADILGEKAAVNLRTIHTSGTTNPDIYMQVTGVKSFLDSFGMNQLDSLDGQWIAIDHTLLDTYSQSLKKAESGSKVSQPKQSVTAPTTTQILDAETKVEAVNKQYLFSTDANKAVLMNEKYVGSQKRDAGHMNNHYIVGYNKAHLQAYVAAIGDALDSSQLNVWAKQASGKSLSDMIDIKSFKDQIDKAKSDYTFSVWADTSTKLISSVEFVDPSNTATTFAFSQHYTGGSSYPLSVGFNTKDDAGNPQNLLLTMITDTQTHVVTLAVTGGTKDSSGETTVVGNLTVTPSNDPITVTAPTGAKSVIEVLKSLGLGGAMPSLPSST